MIFLDIEVPEYQSMRTQEHKVPELLKTIRGRGTIENNNEFGYEERLHLSFTVNEENLTKFLKVYARFQTLCLIPMYNKNLKKKIYDSYLQYKKRTLSNVLVNVGVDEESTEKVVENVFNSSPEETYLKAISEFGYKVNPNANDCMMVFLESFSFKSIQDSSNGYELDMILWVCNDLTFYNGQEIEFLEEYYKCFSTKSEAFEQIDEKIETIILGGKDTYSKGKIEDSLSIIFNNSYNDQETYTPNKIFEKIETPISLNVPSKYIVQVEIRAMNNLKRLPIVGKSKGFIQHLGKGEIGITVKLALNQKNALEEKLIHDIKSISLYQQEYITTSQSDFYLFKGMDIKELSMSTNIIEEPSDDVDITIVTLFFTGSSINKQEIDNNYFTLMDRASTEIQLKLFNKFLDRVLTEDNKIEINPELEKNKVLSTRYADTLGMYLNMIISKSDFDDYASGAAQGELRDDGEFTVESDFTLKTLAKSYFQKQFRSHYNDMSKTDGNLKYEVTVEDIDAKRGVFKGIGEFFTINGCPVDSVFLEYLTYRIERIAYNMKSNYTKGKTKAELDNIVLENMSLDNETQAEFLDKVFSLFLAEFFDAKFLTNEKNLIVYSVSTVFKIEILNNIVVLLKNIFDVDFVTENLFTGDNGSNLKISEDGILNLKIKNTLVNGIKRCFGVMSDILVTDSFMNKVKDFMLTNYYKDADNQQFIETLEKGIKIEIYKAKDRLDSFISNMESENKYIFEICETIFKLEIIASRMDCYGLTSSEKPTGYITGDPISTFTTEAKVYLLTTCVISLFIADLSFEKSVIGNLANGSAKNFIGPHAVTYTAIDTTLGEITASIKKITNGKTVDEYLKDNSGSETNEINFVREYKQIYDNLNGIINIYKKTFGNEYIDELKKLNGTFIRVNSTNKDFQKIHGVKVFADFDTPMSFLKKISNNCDSLKKLFEKTNQTLDKLDDYSKEIDISKLTSNSLTNKKEDGTGIVDNKGVNVTGSEEIDKLLQQVISVFSPSSLISDLTINKFQGNSIMPTTFMQTELLGEFKLLRGLRSATRLLSCQYERMMPDYEVFVIDEKYVEKANERGYDYQDKIYSLSNIISINIKKDDTSNLKNAIIKILNTMPHYIGMNTIFESQSVFCKNENPSVVYSNKFVTEKIVFKAGMIVNVSIDQSSQFFDFTGKIDSVELTSNIITLKCSSFASELLGQSFDISNVYANGLTSIGTKFKNIVRKYWRSPDIVENSKTFNINRHIIPTDYVNRLINGGNDKNAIDKSNYVVAGATGLLFTGIEKSLESIKHLDCPYNELILGKNLSKNIKGTYGKFIQWSNNTFADANDTTSHRVAENINSVEYDLSFYGIQKITLEDVPYITPVTEFQLFDKPIASPKETFIMAHSSFIPQTIQEDIAQADSYTGSSAWKSDQISSPLLLSYCYSYKRDGIKLYDVLNDIELRNPGAYWDVFESGHYGTLFLGRNNYIISRKNKIASLSRENVDEISDLANGIFQKSDSLKKRYLPVQELITSLNLLSELASLYDSNFSKDKKLKNTIKSQQKLSSIRNKNSFYKTNYTFNKDLYEERSLSSNTIIAISGYNLISCSINTNENYFNTVDVKYKPTLGDRWDRFADIFRGNMSKVRLKTFEGLPDERVKAKYIDPSLTVDIHSKEQAFEYAQSVMLKELRNYYSGKIVILYYPDIKKNDDVLLIDSRNKISGTVVVKDFEHIIDSEVGAITIITPGMKVTTSSLVTDIYLTGIVNKLQYEWAKMDTAKVTESELQNINESAAETLQKMYSDVFENIQQIPIAFEYTGYNFEIEKNDGQPKENEKSKEVFSHTDEKGNSVTTTTENREYKYKTPDVIITPRNISSLPFKLYPLIKNGKALIPDEDIYNSVERPFSFVVKLLTALKYYGINTLDFIGHFKNISTLIGELWGQFDASEISIYKNIVDKFLPGFSDSFLTQTEKNVYIERLLADSYYGQILNDINKVNINPLIWDKESMVFFNCQRLTSQDEDRINEIAKVLCQFQIVHVVELSGKNKDDTFEEGPEFTVVEKLRLAMEEHCKRTVSKKNSNCKEWTTVIQSRLITEKPFGDYDDIGAVFINCGKNVANSIITNKEIFEVSCEKSDSHRQDYDNEPNDSIFVKKSNKKVMKYVLNPSKSVTDLSYAINRFNVLVFHNYFGKELGTESLSYEMRRELLNNLLNKMKNKNINNNCILFGDFNLHILDTNDRLNVSENANNEIYNIFKKQADLVKCISDTTTTDGSALYDQIILNKIIKNKRIDKSDVVRFETKFELEEISDHYPIYLFFNSSKINIFPK